MCTISVRYIFRGVTYQIDILYYLFSKKSAAGYKLDDCLQFMLKNFKKIGGVIVLSVICLNGLCIVIYD